MVVRGSVFRAAERWCRRVESSGRARRALIAFGAVAAGGCRVTGQNGTDPTRNGEHAEAVISLQGTGTNDYDESVFYNDDTDTGLVQYKPPGQTPERRVFTGASEFGYSHLKNGDQTFSYTHVNPPSGIAVLWSAPAVTSLPGSSEVWVSFLPVPTSKMPASGFIDGSLANFVADAAMFHSTDRGKTFSFFQRLSNASHTYDGGSLAQSSFGYVFAAYADVTARQIAVWYRSGSGNFQLMASPFSSCSGSCFVASHPIIKVDSAGRLYVMATDSTTPQRLRLTRTTGHSAPFTWEPGVVVASDS